MRTGSQNHGRSGMDVRTEVKRGYLKVILEGEFRMEDLRQAAVRIFDFCFQTGLDKVLIDARNVTGYVPLVTKIDHADIMIEKQMEYIVKGARRLKIAHLMAEGTAEPPGFGETLAANRGGKIFVTTKIEEALRWLSVEEER